MLIRVHLEFTSAIEVVAIVENDLYYCGHTDDSFHLCKSYYSMIFKNKIPKFGSTNCINISPCQKYPDILNDLTPVKEAFIACAYPVISIIKLRPSGSGFSVLYHRI